ncbi:MAG: hypothetical protein KJO93_03550, partial [Muriicola sp.]|nr:hypothetical protein [Muriicola sp.]NNK35077.1 hypothetical protein [Eudoraea sp.]
ARLALREFIAFNKQHPSYVEYAESDNNHYWWIADLYSELGDVDKAFFYLDKAYPNIVNETEIFFLDEHLKPLYNDPRWDAFIDRLSEEFNYDFPHKPE